MKLDTRQSAEGIKIALRRTLVVSFVETHIIFRIVFTKYFHPWHWVPSLAALLFSPMWSGSAVKGCSKAGPCPMAPRAQASHCGEARGGQPSQTTLCMGRKQHEMGKERATLFIYNDGCGAGNAGNALTLIMATLMLMLLTMAMEAMVMVAMAMVVMVMVGVTEEQNRPIAA